MKQTRILMDMPITVEIADVSANKKDINRIFSYFKYIDEKFSVYKETSEIMQINNSGTKKHNWSKDMKTVFTLSEETKIRTNGYFDIVSFGKKYNPSGLVKGWAIYNASKILKNRGFNNFYIEAGGDIQVCGKNKQGRNWSIGIRNPFNPKEIIKCISAENKGIATSGTYIRGNHIYNPKTGHKPVAGIISLTVIGPNIFEADRFATAVFAMSEKGIKFIEAMHGFEGYMIDKKGTATMTSGFEKYSKNYA